jgi:hypothetical protein
MVVIPEIYLGQEPPSGSLIGVSLPATANVLTAGNYSFEFVSLLGCPSVSITAVLTDPGAPVPPVISADNNVSFCDVGTVNITSNIPGIVWNTGETSSTIVVNSSGIYNATITSGACTSVSNNIVVTVNPLPIVSSSSIVVCSDTSQFLLNLGSRFGGVYIGTGIVGGTNFDPSLANLGSNPFTYTYTDINGCLGSSANVIVVQECINSLHETAENSLILYPNPTIGVITIESSIEILGIDVFDVAGRKVSSSQSPTTIDLSSLAEGVYRVLIHTINSNVSRSIVLKR